MNYRGTCKKTLYHGDGKPRERYRNQVKIAGWHNTTLTGDSVTFTDAYNDTADVELFGNTVQASDYYAKDGLSSQAGTPTPDAPIPITSNLAAGTYKTTCDDGIYEFTLTEELRGINDVVDKVVFDRKSHRGILERRNGKHTPDLSINIIEYKPEYAVLQGVYIYTFYIYDGAVGYSTSKNSHFQNVSCNWDADRVAGTYSDHPSVLKKYFSSIETTPASFKTWIIANNISTIYKLATPIRTSLTFTKVASSSATEVPMTFLTSTPSLDYPADVVDAQGDLLSNSAIVGAFPAIRKVGLVTDSHVMRTGVKTKRIEKIASYAGQSITTPYLSTTGTLTTGATVLYQLATPVEEQYAPVDVPTHLGQTIISTDSTVKPGITATAKVSD